MQSNLALMMEHSAGLPSGPQTGLPSLSEARAAGERGMNMALEKAEREHPGWKDLALQFLRSYAAREPRFTAFMVVAQSRLTREFPQPKTEKSWGGVFTRAANEGVIRKTDQSVPHPKRHGCPAWVWESLIYSDAVVRAGA